MPPACDLAALCRWQTWPSCSGWCTSQSCTPSGYQTTPALSCRTTGHRSVPCCRTAFRPVSSMIAEYPSQFTPQHAMRDMRAGHCAAARTEETGQRGCHPSGAQQQGAAAEWLSHGTCSSSIYTVQSASICTYSCPTRFARATTSCWRGLGCTGSLEQPIAAGRAGSHDSHACSQYCPHSCCPCRPEGAGRRRHGGCRPARCSTASLGTGG